MILRRESDVTWIHVNTCTEQTMNRNENRNRSEISNRFEFIPDHVNVLYDYFLPFFVFLETCYVVSCNVQENRYRIHSLISRSSDIIGKQRLLLFQMAKRASTACKFCYPFLTWWLKHNLKFQILSKILENNWNWFHLFVRNYVNWYLLDTAWKIRSIFGPYFPGFSLNAWLYESEKLRIRTLFMQWRSSFFELY